MRYVFFIRQFKGCKMRQKSLLKKIFIIFIHKWVKVATKKLLAFNKHQPSILLHHHLIGGLHLLFFIKEK